MIQEMDEIYSYSSEEFEEDVNLDVLANIEQSQFVIKNGNFLI